MGTKRRQSADQAFTVRRWTNQMSGNGIDLTFLQTSPYCRLGASFTSGLKHAD